MDTLRQCQREGAPSQEISVYVSGTAFTELRGGVEVLTGRGTVSATAPPLKATLIPDAYCSSPELPATLDTAGISFDGPLGEHVPFQWKDGSSGGSVSIEFSEDADCRV